MSATDEKPSDLFPCASLEVASHELLERFGEVMKGRDLASLLGFGSDRSFARAATTGQLPVPIFRMTGRRGWFARTRDVVAWLHTVATAPATAQVQGPTDLKEGG